MIFKLGPALQIIIATLMALLKSVTGLALGMETFHRHILKFCFPGKNEAILKRKYHIFFINIEKCLRVPHYLIRPCSL